MSKFEKYYIILASEWEEFSVSRCILYIRDDKDECVGKVLFLKFLNSDTTHIESECSSTFGDTCEEGCEK